jgi:hypothetical protein
VVEVFFHKYESEYTFRETVLEVSGDGVEGCGGEAATGIADFAPGIGVFCACDESDVGAGLFVWGRGKEDVCEYVAAMGGVFGAGADYALRDG